MSVEFPEVVDKTKNHYTTLNCHRLSSEEQILAEYKVLAKRYHPDTETGNKEKFQAIDEAKRILLCPSLKKSYDSWLDSGLSVSFETWKEKCASHMHWVKPENKKFRLLDRSEVQGSSKLNDPDLSWERHTDNTIELFRSGKL